MYIEFKAGSKHPDIDAPTSDSMEHFRDAGYVITDDDLIVDIDCLSREQIDKLLIMFGINTHTVWTDRGVHLYFNRGSFGRGANRNTCLGFPIELKHKGNTKAITVKRDGVPREVENKGIRQDIPTVFRLNKKFDTLLGRTDGENRNNALFRLRTQLAGVEGWQNILRYVNNYIFEEPLEESEFQNIARDMVVKAEKDNEYDIATYMMTKYRIVNYSEKLYFYLDNKYHTDDPKLTRLIWEKVGEQKVRYVDEVMRQISTRSTIISPDTEFDIKFNNGILRRGEFIEIESEEFTPYVIEVDYNPEAEPVHYVNNYINHLTNGDEDYKNLLLEIMAHSLIVNKEFKRMLAKFFIFIGSGGNGKGTLLQIIKHILGGNNCTGLSVTNMSDERYLTSMKGKLANLGDDIQDEPINNEQMKMLKNISTCDTIEARELYKNSATVTLTTTLIFTSNHVLKTFEKGQAYKRRVMWCPMFTEVKEDKKDPNFISNLTTKETLEYWIRLIIDAYFRLHQNKHFTESSIVNKYNEAYHRENNSAIIFAEEMDREDFIDRKPPEVYASYEIWAEESGHDSPASKKMVKEAIEQTHGLTVAAKYINGKTHRVYSCREGEMSCD